MKTELTQQMKEWIDRDAVSFEPFLAAARKDSMRKLPLYMIISIVGMCVLGLAVGAGVDGVIRMHLPVGIGIALFIALIMIWQKNSIINKKSVIKAYKRGAKSVFKNLPEEEQNIFCHQMSEKRYDEITYQEKLVPFQSKVIIGSDYWVYRNSASSFFIKASDVVRIYFRKTNVKVSYEKSSSNVKKNVAIGSELVVEYKSDSVISQSNEVAMFFDDNNQAIPVLTLIQKHCPHISIE